MSMSPVLSSIDQYKRLIPLLQTYSPELRVQIARRLCLTDLFFLLWFGLRRADMEQQWLLDRCREVQASPDGNLDLWAREHYKSTIITYALTIQDILNDPNLTVGIFSHTRPNAKGFLKQIKREFEDNTLLKSLFPDVLYDNPQKESPSWSEDGGIIVRRAGNPKEATVEAWGLVDGQPTGKHFRMLVYDDVVTLDSVTSPDMIAKTTSALELSYNLGAQGGRRRFIGTRYHFNDTYRTLMDRGTAKVRLHPARKDGSETGEPVFMSDTLLKEKRRDMGPYTFGTQMLLNPKGDETQGFKRDWLRYYDKHNNGEGMNRYILVDAANEKRKENDYTSMWVIGLGPDRNFYVLDIVRDRINLSQRTKRLFNLHRKWRPLQVRYERYGMMGDIQHIQSEQEAANYRFDVIEVAGQTPKADRIKRLVPLFEQRRVYLPHSYHVTDYEGQTRDLIHDFVEQEYLAFPVSAHDDMLDALARIAEPEDEKHPEYRLIWPAYEERVPDIPVYADGV